MATLTQNQNSFAKYLVWCGVCEYDQPTEASVRYNYTEYENEFNLRVFEKSLNISSITEIQQVLEYTQSGSQVKIFDRSVDSAFWDFDSLRDGHMYHITLSKGNGQITLPGIIISSSNMNSGYVTDACYIPPTPTPTQTDTPTPEQPTPTPTPEQTPTPTPEQTPTPTPTQTDTPTPEQPTPTPTPEQTPTPTPEQPTPTPTPEQTPTPTPEQPTPTPTPEQTPTPTPEQPTPTPTPEQPTPTPTPEQTPTPTPEQPTPTPTPEQTPTPTPEQPTPTPTPDVSDCCTGKTSVGFSEEDDLGVSVQYESEMYAGGKFCFTHVTPEVVAVTGSTNAYYAFDDQGNIIGWFTIQSENGLEDYEGDESSDYGVFYYVTTDGKCLRGDMSTGTANDYGDPVIFR